MTSSFQRPTPAGSDRPPPSRLEAFIAELLLSGVTPTEIKRAAQRATPWKDRPEKVLNTAAEIAQLLRVTDA